MAAEVMDQRSRDRAAALYQAIGRQPPALQPWERLLCKVLPGPMRPYWKLERLFAVDLAAHEPTPPRDDVSVEWLDGSQPMSEGGSRFLIESVGNLVGRAWKRRLQRRQCQLGLAGLDGRIVHYTFVLPDGVPAFGHYAALAHPDSAAIGPSYTADAARGRGVFPYMVGRALDRLKEAGVAWAYISAQTKNASSLKGLRKIPRIIEVGDVLYRRPFLRASRICGVAIEVPEATRPPTR